MLVAGTLTRGSLVVIDADRKAGEGELAFRVQKTEGPQYMDQD